MMTDDASPRDGPATTFQADPLVRLILERERYPCDEFGLVLVAGWPPDQRTLQDPYRKFMASVRECFDLDDHEDGNVYLYPAECLHVTVATLHGVNKSTKDAHHRRTLEDFWSRVVKTATDMPEWPTRSLNLTITRAQIGDRAGILLWNETSGGLKQVRDCIARATELNREDTVDTGTLSIPPIAHSTFLRFPNPPNTRGEVLQEKFRRTVLSLKDLFVSPMVVDDVKLVCERTPYMHIPKDDHHVLGTFPLRGER